MIGLFKTIFFLVIVYYLIRFVSNILVPYFRAVTEINDRQKIDQNPYVQHKEAKPKHSRPTEGDYVDYKEVE
jgi:hypothetical protein